MFGNQQNEEEVMTLGQQLQKMSDSYLEPQPPNQLITSGTTQPSWDLVEKLDL